MPQRSTTSETPPDDEIARWCELAEQRAGYDLVRAAAARSADPTGPTAAIVGGILPVTSLPSLDSAFFNRVVGLGVEAPATEALLDEALAFYVGLGQQHVSVALSPVARPPALAGWLGERAFVPRSRWAKCWRLTGDVAPVTTDLRIETIGPERADAFDDLVMEGFGLPPPVRGVAASFVGRDGWMTYLGYDGERPVTAAAMRVDDGVAWLGFGATLEDARGRGGQSAMFARRLMDARDLGCRMAVTETGEDSPDDPNPSLHNMLRAGFQVAYLRQNWVRG